MNWIIDFTRQARADLKCLDRPIRNRIRKYIDDLETLPNPRLRGEPLKGNLSEYWKYRVGDYRIVCEIQDQKLVILVVKIGHRRDVYKI